MVKMRKRALLGASVLVITSCGNRFDGPPAPTFPVVIRVDSDPGVPLAGATVLRKDQVIGQTGPDGRLKLTFQGTEGDVLEVHVHCPAQYQTPIGAILVPLRQLSDLKPPEYSAKCPPNLRKVVVVIRAENGPYLPVMHLNQVIGRTDASGTATFLANVAPNESLEFTLQTSSDTAFKRHSPIDPKVQYLVQASDEVVVLNQVFSVAKAPPVYYAPKQKPVQIGPRRTF
jgi:hypothetical protein